MMKKVGYILIFLWCSSLLDGTLGDSSHSDFKNLNLRGTLELYASLAKEVDHIYFWNGQTRVSVFEVPEMEIAAIQGPDAPFERTLKDNPAEFEATALLDLTEIDTISVAHPNGIWVYQKSKDGTKVEFVLIAVVFKSGIQRFYFVEKSSKISCQEVAHNGHISLDVPIRAIKMLTVTGYLVTDPSLECPKK